MDSFYKMLENKKTVNDHRLALFLVPSKSSEARRKRITAVTVIRVFSLIPNARQEDGVRFGGDTLSCSFAGKPLVSLGKSTLVRPLLCSASLF